MSTNVLIDLDLSWTFFLLISTLISALECKTGRHVQYNGIMMTFQWEFGFAASVMRWIFVVSVTLDRDIVMVLTPSLGEWKHSCA